MSGRVVYTAALQTRQSTVLFVSGLLDAERRRRGTRRGRRALDYTGTRCWCCGGSATRPGWRKLAADNRISFSTVYRSPGAGRPR